MSAWLTQVYPGKRFSVWPSSRSSLCPLMKEQIVDWLSKEVLFSRSMHQKVKKVKRTHPAFTPAGQAGTRFTDHLMVEGWTSQLLANIWNCRKSCHVLLFRKLLTVCIEECRLETILQASVDSNEDDGEQTTHTASSHGKASAALWLSVFKVSSMNVLDQLLLPLTCYLYNTCALLTAIFNEFVPSSNDHLGQSGLAGCPCGSQFPVIFMLSVLTGQAETVRNLLFEVDRWNGVAQMIHRYPMGFWSRSVCRPESPDAIPVTQTAASKHWRNNVIAVSWSPYFNHQLFSPVLLTKCKVFFPRQLERQAVKIQRSLLCYS